MKNQRGEVATILLIAGAALLIGTFAPKLNPINWITGQNGTTTAPMERIKKDYRHFISEPVLIKNGENVAVGQRVEETVDRGEDYRERKLTIQERIGGFISNLTIWGLVFTVVSILFFGGAPIAWVAGKYFKVKGTLVKTVKGIKEAKSKDAEHFERVVKPALQSAHDESDKKTISKIKSQLT